MGYKKSYNVIDAARVINSAARESSSQYNDGFTAWGAKQDLYLLKWLIDDALERCPEFAPEKDWLKEQNKKRMWETLKGNK